MKILSHKFVDYIPENINEETLYISIEYSTAVHNCVCGCGNEVITPLSPTDWEITFNGDTVSLSPSIGNWSFECKSHYFIRNNMVLWSKKWDEKEVELGREQDKKVKKDFYSKGTTKTKSKRKKSKSNFDFKEWFKQKK